MGQWNVQAVVVDGRLAGFRLELLAQAADLAIELVPASDVIADLAIERAKDQAALVVQAEVAS